MIIISSVDMSWKVAMSPDLSKLRQQNLAWSKHSQHTRKQTA
jgi:hypothetical protein